MHFEVVAAVPEDVPVIGRLIRALADYEKLSHLAVATDELIARELFGPDPVIECVVARDGKAQAVGFALFFHNFSTFLGRRGLYLEDLFVVPEVRRQGCGTALLKHLARIAVERGCGRFEWSVLDWNEPAIRFYRALGADVLPDWRIVRVTGEALRTLGRGP
jgi:hypothetical protein